MDKPSSIKNFENSMNETVRETLLSKWYWFIFVAIVKISTIYLVRNIIPFYEIPINVYAKEEPALLYSTVTFIVLYKGIELLLNNITDLVLRRNFNAISKRLKIFLIEQINRTKIHFLQEQGAAAIVNSFNACTSNYVGTDGMLYTISYIIPDFIMVAFIFSIILKNSTSLVALSVLWAITSIVTYLATTRGIEELVAKSQEASGAVYTMITNKIKNRQLEFFYGHDAKSTEIFKDYEEQSQTWQERISLQYQILGFFFNVVLLGIQTFAFTLYLSYLLNAGRISFGQFQDVFYANNAFCSVVGNLLKNIPKAIKQYKESEVFPNMLAPHLQPPTENLTIAENPDIVIENVECIYSGMRALNCFSLNIPFGSKVAVVGVPGAGKTTLLNLICSIVDVTCGSIHVGGVPINQASRESIAATFSYIFADPKLLLGTLRNNLTIGNDIPQLEIEDALIEIGLEKWIDNLDRELQESAVSNDEKKNIMFLRTYLLLNKTSIILADSPTEGMTGDTKAKAIEMLKKSANGKTFIVAEDEFISDCEKVIFIDRKRVYFGTHAEFLNSKPSYKALFDEPQTQS